MCEAQSPLGQPMGVCLAVLTAGSHLRSPLRGKDRRSAEYRTPIARQRSDIAVRRRLTRRPLSAGGRSGQSPGSAAMPRPIAMLPNPDLYDARCSCCRSSRRDRSAGEAPSAESGDEVKTAFQNSTDVIAPASRRRRPLVGRVDMPSRSPNDHNM